jgi:hypothetical protein
MTAASAAKTLDESGRTRRISPKYLIWQASTASVRNNGAFVTIENLFPKGIKMMNREEEGYVALPQYAVE